MQSRIFVDCSRQPMNINIIVIIISDGLRLLFRIAAPIRKSSCMMPRIHRTPLPSTTCQPERSPTVDVLPWCLCINPVVQITHKIEYSTIMPATARIDYQPLSPDEDQIRALVLHAGKVNELLKCSLRVISLEDNPVYEALSYTWGDVNVTRPIEVEGAIFDATVNLERALRHLRDVAHDQTLWVDAGM